MKKIPQRTCIGCKEVKPKKELIRIVKSADNDISIDVTGKKNGRGAYICKDIKCLDMAIKNKRLSREFEMAIPNEIYDKLREELVNESE
ncbi:MAG: YlxR family protein [Clostridia bacterium]|nr:YlxR family protein [Clostridia bacterium]